MISSYFNLQFFKAQNGVQHFISLFAWYILFKLKIVSIFPLAEGPLLAGFFLVTWHELGSFLWVLASESGLVSKYGAQGAGFSGWVCVGSVFRVLALEHTLNG